MRRSSRVPGNTITLYGSLRMTGHAAHPERLAAGAVGGKLHFSSGCAGVEVAQAFHVARGMRWPRAQVLAAVHGAAISENISCLKNLNWKAHQLGPTKWIGHWHTPASQLPPLQSIPATRPQAPCAGPANMSATTVTAAATHTNGRIRKGLRCSTTRIATVPPRT
jgi:hypothetical protein